MAENVRIYTDILVATNTAQCGERMMKPTTGNNNRRGLIARGSHASPRSAPPTHVRAQHQRDGTRAIGAPRGFCPAAAARLNVRYARLACAETISASPRSAPPAPIRAQHQRMGGTPPRIGALIVFQNRHQGAADSQAEPLMVCTSSVLFLSLR